MAFVPAPTAHAQIPKECEGTESADRLEECIARNALKQQKSANCKTQDGKDGVSIGIAVGGKTCFALSTGTANSNPIVQYFTQIIRYLAMAVGIAVVGGIVAGGIVYGTARGNSGQTEKGIMIITNAVIGLVLFILMAAILNFLVPGGILE